MKTFRSLAALFALAAGILAGVGCLTACGTGIAAADPAASTPATSHFKADLAVGYRTLQAVRIASASALQAHAITADQAQAVQTQAGAFTATLDSLRALGDSPGNQTTLTATILAINAATVFITASQGAQK